MPATLRKLLFSFLPVSTLLAVALPTAIALLVAHWVGMQRLGSAGAATSKHSASTLRP